MCHIYHNHTHNANEHTHTHKKQKPALTLLLRAIHVLMRAMRARARDSSIARSAPIAAAAAAGAEVVTNARRRNSVRHERNFPCTVVIWGSVHTSNSHVFHALRRSAKTTVMYATHTTHITLTSTHSGSICATVVVVAVVDAATRQLRKRASIRHAHKLIQPTIIRAAMLCGTIPTIYIRRTHGNTRAARQRLS